MLLFSELKPSLIKINFHENSSNSFCLHQKSLEITRSNILKKNLFNSMKNILRYSPLSESIKNRRKRKKFSLGKKSSIEQKFSNFSRKKGEKFAFPFANFFDLLLLTFRCHVRRPKRELYGSVVYSKQSNFPDRWASKLLHPNPRTSLCPKTKSSPLCADKRKAVS